VNGGKKGNKVTNNVKKKHKNTKTTNTNRNEENLTFRADHIEPITLKPMPIKEIPTTWTRPDLNLRNYITYKPDPEPETLNISAGGSKVRTNDSTKLFNNNFKKTSTKKCTTC
jgi:hypothetical protein